MKARFLALAALLFGMAACQTEPEGLDVNMDGTTTISVVLPEDAMTRAGYTDSAQSGLANTEGETIRVVMRIYDENGRESDNRYVDYLSGDERTANFDVRLVPNRQYTFVAWADQVEGESDVDKYFDTFDDSADLAKVTFIGDTWTAMNENRDAYTATHTEANYTSASNITLTLTRPFAKLRVVTTDMVDLKNLGIEPPFYATMSYTEAVPTSFDAISGTIGDNYDSEAKVFSKFVIKDYDSNTETNKTLFTDYVLIPESNVVKFTLDVYEDAACTKLIKSNAFTTDIPVKRNNLTTIQGNILTDGNNINVTVDEKFDGETQWPDANNNAEQLAYAAMFGGEVTLSEDVVLTQPLEIVDGTNVVINLNGKTITGTSVKGKGAIIENNGALTLVGGTIKNTETNGEAVINNNGELVLDGVKIEGAPMDNGSNYPEYAVKSSGKMTINNNTDISSYRGCIRLTGEGETIINKGVFTNHDITRTLTSHVVYVSGTNKLTINGGTFSHLNLDASGSVVICNATTGTIYINNGNFNGGNYFSGQHNLSDYGYGGKFSVKGGTFSDNISSKYIADGYKAVQSGDKYMVVKEDVGGVATDNATLDTAIQNAQDGDTIALNAGEYVIPDSAVGKTITFVGTGAPEDTLITAQDDGAAEGNCDYSLRGSKATFENVTITTTGTYFPGYVGCQGTYKNCIINGVFTLYASSSFEDCTFNISGDLYNVWTWGAAEATFTNCTFNCDGKAMLLYGQENTKLTMNNCVFNDNGDDTVTGKAAIEIGNDYNKSYELTVNNATVNGFAINPNGFVTGTTLWANKNSMPADKLKVTVDGKNAYNYVVAADDTQSFTNAINNGATEVALSNGNYTMPEPDLRGKTLTISGTKDVVIDATAVDARDQFVTGATMVFDGVTINFGKGLYMGFANTASLTYKNCKINGLQFLFGENVTFENCEFDSNGAEHSVWTYGAKNVSFTKCDFTYGDRCVNCYSDNDVVGGKQTVNFTKCTFVTNNTASEGAVEINSTFFSVGIEVNLDGCTAPAYGQMAYVSPWDSTNGAKTTINIK